MAKTITIYSGSKIATFSINRIAEAIHDAVVRLNKTLQLHESAEFGGTSSAAFREGLVREYNAKHTKECPKCGLELSFLDDDTADCRHCKKTYSFPKEGANLCYISEDGVAEFVARKIGNGFANRTGDYYHLGPVGSRTLYYGTAPNKQFYTKHKGDNIALVLGSNHAEVPENWTGHIVPLSELFYLNESNGEIRVSRNRLHYLLPDAKRPHRTNGKRKVHRRRSNWLMFISNLLCKPYRESDFYRGELRPQVARDWFVDNVIGAPKNTKEYQRDLHAFRHLPKNEGDPDQRENVLVLLLRIAADKKRSPKDRMSIAKVIPELVTYLQKREREHLGRPVEITRGVWQFCRDNTKEFVPVSEIDKFFDELDSKTACSA